MYQGTSIMPFYTKTYHRQNTQLYISMVQKVNTVSDVVTDTLSGATCSSCNSWQEGTRSIPAVPWGCYSASLKLWILRGSHSAFNDPIPRCERVRTDRSNLSCSSSHKTFKFSKKGQIKVTAPEGQRVGKNCLMLKQRHRFDWLPFGKM